jgi:aryl-alcohol dehydrogenase-like predicted oxidoreductase
MSFQRISRREALKTGAIAVAALSQFSPARGLAQQEPELPPIFKAIPSTGEKLPVIGLGTNAFGAQTAEQKAPLREVLERLPQLGGKLVDTAQIYGNSESVIGELVEGLGNRKELFIATKTPTKGDYSNPQAVIDKSFADLRTDVIDLLQIHSLGGLVELLPAFDKAKSAGRVRYIGMSTSNDAQYEQTLAAMEKYPLDFVQVDYSIDNRNAADGILAKALDRKIGVLINVPFGGRNKATTTFAKVQGKPLPDWAAEIDATSWPQVLLKYVVSHPAVTATIPGTTKVRHLEENEKAGRGRLPNEALRREIEQYWDALG